MGPDTIDALRRYRDFFRYGDVDVGPALEVLPHAAKLQQLQRHLDLASALVGRHIAATVKPVVGVVSDVRRIAVATPEGSSVRDAFTTFDARWRETFPGGTRTAPKAAKDDAAPNAAPPRRRSSAPHAMLTHAANDRLDFFIHCGDHIDADDREPEGTLAKYRGQYPDC